MKQHDFPVLGRKIQDGLRQGEIFLVLVRHRQGQFFKNLPSVDVPHPGRAEHVLALIDGDAHQPCLFANDAAGKQLVHVLINLDKRLLRGILGRSCVVQVEQAHPLDAVAVLLHEAHKHGLAHVFCIGGHHAVHPLQG